MPFLSRPSLCFKVRQTAKSLTLKRYSTPMQMMIIFTRKILHLASLWKQDIFQLGIGLLYSRLQIHFIGFKIIIPKNEIKIWTKDTVKHSHGIFFLMVFRQNVLVIVPSSNVGNVTNAVKQKTSVKNKRDICWYNGSSRKRTPSGVRTQKRCP